MRVNLGVTEVGVAILTVVISLGASWVAVKEQVASQDTAVKELTQSTELTREVLKELKDQQNAQEVSLMRQEERYDQLSRTTDDYRYSMERLSEVLGNLNVTLGRMDERLKGVEQGLRDIE